MSAPSIQKIALLTKLTPKPRRFDGWAKRILFSRLAKLQHGSITFIEAEQSQTFGTLETTHHLPAIHVTIEVLDSRFYGDVVFGGSIGAGEAYMLSYFNCDNLSNLIRLMARNQRLLDNIEGGLAKLTAPLQKGLHSLNRNTQQGSRRNIAAHYDLGNDFFELMLDKTMMYSSGIFKNKNSTLESASLTKLARICQKLDLKKEDHLIEIGTGWGGFAIYAAQHYGCKITTTTISAAQYDLAKKRISDLGLDGQITVLLSDYRDLTGTYDKLVSIEMIEAVGHEFYDTYFAHCSRLLKPEGLMLLQAITIVDQRYASAIKSVDFIQRYIFPGSCIPSVTALLTSITKSSDLRLFDLEDIGPHYATTLAKWRENVFKHKRKIQALGYPEVFLRMWEFYLCYCEGGFEERALGDVHMLLAKPDNRRLPLR